MAVFGVNCLDFHFVSFCVDGSRAWGQPWKPFVVSPSGPHRCGAFILSCIAGTLGGCWSVGGSSCVWSVDFLRSCPESVRCLEFPSQHANMGRSSLEPALLPSQNKYGKAKCLTSFQAHGAKVFNPECASRKEERPPRETQPRRR